jgi:hypothetical protein
MFSFNGDVFVPGDVVAGRTATWLKSTSGGGHLDDGPYFAYVIRSRGFPRVPPMPRAAIPAGRVYVEPHGNGRYGTAGVSFTLPELEPGRYWIANCNDPCTTSLGDLMATPITVATDRGEARLVAITDRLEDRLIALRHRVVNRVLGTQRRTLSTRLDVLRDEVAALEAEIAALREADAAPPGEESSSLAPLLAFVLPAAALGAVVGRRYRRSA